MTLAAGFCILLLIVAIVALLLYAFKAPIAKPDLLGLALALYLICQLAEKLWGH